MKSRLNRLTAQHAQDKQISNTGGYLSSWLLQPFGLYKLYMEYYPWQPIMELASNQYWNGMGWTKILVSHDRQGNMLTVLWHSNHGSIWHCDLFIIHSSSKACEGRNKENHRQISLCAGLSPLPVRVTTRTITFLVGNPYINLHFHYYWEGRQPKLCAWDRHQFSWTFGKKTNCERGCHGCERWIPWRCGAESCAETRW